ncbi:MAG: outer membrane protein assembly factor BamD (BamD/ComL family) [Gammaproteobacteria bacterium]|jgi:outer membrane protein assembly factor BamD (BamD/ComL family)
MMLLDSLLNVVRIDRLMEFANVNSKLEHARSRAHLSMRMRALCLCAGVLVTSVSVAQSRIASELEAEDVYSLALRQIEAEQYVGALASLRQVQRRYPSYTKMAGVQTRMAVLQESADAGISLGVFLRALTLRDNGDMDSALVSLEAIASADPAGTLTDDSLYIMAYLQVMDRYDFAKARESLRTLEERFPESAYTDSAQYLEAIALEQLGSTAAAKTLLMDLRDRHTALNLPMDFRWPKGTVLSRYWFDRADRRLAIVEERVTNASRLNSRQQQRDGKLRVAVNVSGVDLQLLLVPSPLTRQTQWLDGDLADQLPPSLGIYDGTVEGVTDSWVRVVLQNSSIIGAVHMNGKQHKLRPDNLIGTLEYYQPSSRNSDGVRSVSSGLADSVQGLDALIAPPAELSQALQGRSRAVHTDVRAVPVSIVIDSQFNRYYGGEGLSEALNNMNIADGMYRQFGLALVLDEAVTLAEESDPLNHGKVTLETILRRFRDYRLQYKTLFGQSALTYLFTGNPRSDATLGLAWIDTACRTDGYDVGVTTPSSFGDVLLTHELGHSLGAQHDTDTACDDNEQSLMWPNISSRTESEFSECSKTSVMQSRGKQCLSNSVDLSLNASSTGTTVNFEVVNPDASLTLDAQLLIETSVPDQLQWPAGCQRQTPTSAKCFVDTLQPGEMRAISFPVNDQFQNSDAPVTAKLSPMGLLELKSNDNLATVLVEGGASTQHLIAGSNPSVSSITTSSPNGGATTAPSAASSAGSLGWLQLLSLTALLVQCRRRRICSPAVPRHSHRN